MLVNRVRKVENRNGIKNVKNGKPTYILIEEPIGLVKILIQGKIMQWTLPARLIRFVLYRNRVKRNLQPSYKTINLFCIASKLLREI